jgi:RNA polymerase sigma-70 factor (ECF subfamily)
MRNRKKRDHDYTNDTLMDYCNIEDMIIQFETENQKKQKLMEALLSLTSRQKEAIYLKFFDGLSNEEISKVMKVNKQSVYNHISKAIHTMQNYVKS